eukprot:365034-Chlamydomonas_euryale.AAC.12
MATSAMVARVVMGAQAAACMRARTQPRRQRRHQQRAAWPRRPHASPPPIPTPRAAAASAAAAATAPAGRSKRAAWRAPRLRRAWTAPRCSALRSGDNQPFADTSRWARVRHALLAALSTLPPANGIPDALSVCTWRSGSAALSRPDVSTFAYGHATQRIREGCGTEQAVSPAAAAAPSGGPRGCGNRGTHLHHGVAAGAVPAAAGGGAAPVARVSAAEPSAAAAAAAAAAGAAHTERRGWQRPGSRPRQRGGAATASGCAACHCSPGRRVHVLFADGAEPHTCRASGACAVPVQWCGRVATHLEHNFVVIAYMLHTSAAQLPATLTRPKAARTVQAAP